VSLAPRFFWVVTKRIKIRDVRKAVKPEAVPFFLSHSSPLPARDIPLVTKGLKEAELLIQPPLL